MVEIEEGMSEMYGMLNKGGTKIDPLEMPTLRCHRLHCLLFPVIRVKLLL